MRKQLLITAFMFLCVIELDAQNAIASRTINYKGNIIEMTHRIDTVGVTDPATQQEEIYVLKTIIAEKLNGQKIYQNALIDTFNDGVHISIRRQTGLLYSNILKGIEPLFKDVEDGVYNIEIPSILINPKAILVYDSSCGIYSKKGDSRRIPTSVEDAIDRKISAMLMTETFTRISVDGKPVPYYLSLRKVIRVINHHIIALN